MRGKRSLLPIVKVCSPVCAGWFLPIFRPGMLRCIGVLARLEALEILSMLVSKANNSADEMPSK